MYSLLFDNTHIIVSAFLQVLQGLVPDSILKRRSGGRLLANGSYIYNFNSNSESIEILAMWKPRYLQFLDVLQTMTYTLRC